MRNRTQTSTTTGHLRLRWMLICGLAAICTATATPAALADDIFLTPADEFAAIEKMAATGDNTRTVRVLKEFLRTNARWERIEEANRLYGIQLVESGDVSMGIEILDRLIREDPEAARNAPAYFYRGKGLEALGDFPGAVLAYDVVLRRFPEHPLAPQSALNEAIVSEKILKNVKRAREVYELFATNYHNHQATPSVLNHLALMAEQEGDIEGAVKRYIQYARAYPDDIGDPMMNGTVAGAAEAMWRAAALTEQKLRRPKEGCDLYQEYARLPLASRQRGLLQATLMAFANPEAGDGKALFAQAIEADPSNEGLRLRYGHWLAGPAKQPEEAIRQYEIIISTSKNRGFVADCLSRLGPEKVKSYLDRNPTRLVVMKHYLQGFKDGDKRAEGRATLDAWIARADIGWKTAISKQWFEWTKELEDCARVIKCADEEGRMQDSLAATLTVADILINQKAPDAAHAALAKALGTWSIYPDFPKAAFATKLVQIALSEPLMMPKPAVEGQPAPAEGETVVSPKGKAARETAGNLIRQHKLDADPAGADLLAQLAHELDPKAAVPAMQKALELLIDAGKHGEATKYVGWLFEQLPPHSPEVADVVSRVAAAGNKPWGKLWTETIVPKAQEEFNHFNALNPPTEQSRLAKAKLSRVLEAAQSVAAHQDFLANHAGSAAADEIRTGLWSEMTRAGIDAKPLILQAIKDLEKEPRLTRSIPLDQVPAGPEGIDLYEVNVRKAKVGDAGLAADLLLNLARLQQRFRRQEAAMITLRELVGKYGNTPQAIESKRLASALFGDTYFGPGVVQADAEQAFAWMMELMVNEQADCFADVSGAPWRAACHPAYRLHTFEDFDALHMFQSHNYEFRPNDLPEFLNRVYGSYPGEGSGAINAVQNGTAPYGGGDKFMLYRWGILRAPVDGPYNFWFGGYDYVGFAIDGQVVNIPRRDYLNHAGLWLSRGLHILNIAYEDWGGGASATMDWQPPGGQRQRLNVDAFSTERYPLLLSVAAQNTGAFGLAQWDAYVRKYPNDLRGRMMRLETLVLHDPSRAIGELENLMKKFPGNLRFRERYADCLWRMGRQADALKQYQELAKLPEQDLWESSYNALCKEIFLGGNTPNGFDDQLEDRTRAAGDWSGWLARAREQGDDAALQAHTWAEMQLNSWADQAVLRQQAVGRINGSIAREQAQVAAAKALAEKPDTKPEVKAQALAAVKRSEQRTKDLQNELKRAEAQANAADARVAQFRKALGLAPDQPTLDLPVAFGAGCLQRGSISAQNAQQLANRIWGTADKDRARPFLEYVIKYSPDSNLVTWCADRLVDLAMAGKDVGGAADILASVGMRNPHDGHHAQRLAKACELAMQSGSVYTFARSAQVLARLHGGNKQLSSYLPQLGTVFEKAGNYASAEYEFTRVIKASRDPALKRAAQLSLASLYEKVGRSADALQVLSSLIPLELPTARGVRRPVKVADGKEEDTHALLIATRAYLSLEKSTLALDTYARAESQKNFGKDAKPDFKLLEDLARSCMLGAGPDADKKQRDPGEALPATVLGRGQTVLSLIDTMLRFYGKEMDTYQKVTATLLRADANIMMRNYPRAIEEIREAKKVAGDTRATYLADLKMGEVHLATDNDDQAMPIFRKLSTMNLPDVSPVALFWLGTTHLKMNRRDEAIESFRMLWQRFSDSELVRHAIYTIARTYAEQGAFLDAIRLYEAVGAINSTLAEKVVPGEMLTVKVWDADHYLGTGEYTIPVSVRSSSGDSERMLLDMNKINQSLFLGTIRVELGEPEHGDGVLQVYGTDMIYVTYQDRFKGVAQDEELTAESVEGGKTTNLIQVVADADIRISPTVFVERDDEEEDIYVEKTEEELAEERRLQQLSAKLERGEAVVRPGNPVYIRVEDADLDSSGEPDKIKVNVFTYSPEQTSQSRRQTWELARRMEQPLGMDITSRIPDNGEFTWSTHQSPEPGNRPRLDHVIVELTETGPHTGIFYGEIKTDVNGPTAIASDTSGDKIAAYAIDGKNGADDAWMGFIDNKPGKWLEIDLKEIREIGKIVWDRGEGADDRYMIDYTLTLRGDGAPVMIERKGNKSAHNNEIALDKPVECRWVRFTALTFEGDAPAISQVQIFDKEGNQIVPGGTSPIERAQNDILEFNVGDCMAAEMLDHENADPGRPVKRTSNPLGVAYVDGHIDAVYISYGKNDYRGNLLFDDHEDDKNDVYARRTKRVKADDVLQIAIADPDLDVDKLQNTATCEVLSSTGDRTKLKATEIGPTSGVFLTRIQLSSNPAAMEDDRLYVEPHGYILLRYHDEQNRSPGHAVYRNSYVFIADDEVADFVGTEVVSESPQMEADSLSVPNKEFTLCEPDQALPKIDRVEMQALSFATGDFCRFSVLLRNLDGVFSSRLPITIGDKPQVKRPKDADPRAARRVNTLDDYYWWHRVRGTQVQGRRAEEEDAFNIPMAVVGDDMIWTSYVDQTPAATAGRVFVPVIEPATVERLQLLGVRPDVLPEEACKDGLLVAVRDPYLELADAKKERERMMMEEIARKKRQYKMLLAQYNDTIIRINKRIEELTPKDEAAAKPAEPAEQAPPAAVADADAPLVEEEIEGIDEFGAEDFLATENLILAASLRRDRDGLVEAMKALEKRTKALDRYPTDEMEAAIDAAEQKARAELDAAGEAEGSGEAVKVAKETPWYLKADWWTNCGGIMPGTLLKVKIEDPDIQEQTLEVKVVVLGSEIPHSLKLRAKAVPDTKGVFELDIPTAPGPNDEGALSLKGASSIMITYTDTVQQKFTDKRSSYLSLASNAEFNVTGPDFLEPKERFHLGEEIYVIVQDIDMDKTPERDYIWVEFTSDVGDRELVPIRESQPHTGAFRGSIRTQYSEPKENDGVLSAKFGGTFTARYIDTLWYDAPDAEKRILPPAYGASGSFVPGTDGEVEIFARQLKRGSLQRDVLFNTALAEYELGKSSTEMGAVQRGRQHLLESREKYRMLIEQYPDDPVCAHATYYLGNIHFLLGDYPAAVKSLQEVIDRWPKSEFKAKSLYKLGTCHLKAGEMKRAIECFVNLAYHHSDSPLVADGMLTLAQHFSSRKQYKAASGIGYAFVRKFPGHEKAGNVYLRLAGWLIVEKHYAQAIEVLEEAQKELPDSANMAAFLYWHADCLFKISGPNSIDYKRGIVLLQRVTYDYPDSKWAKYAAARLAEKDVMQ